jgi:hypothetical protein
VRVPSAPTDAEPPQPIVPFALMFTELCWSGSLTPSKVPAQAPSRVMPERGRTIEVWAGAREAGRALTDRRAGAQGNAADREK